MSKYLEEQTANFKRFKERIEAEPSPHRRRILENYLRHVALEVGFGPRWEDIFCDEMTVEHPVYRIQLFGATEFTVYDGEAAVRGFYESLAGGVNLITSHCDLFAVADWGFMNHENEGFYVDGRTAKNLGIEVDDLDAHYRLGCEIIGIWHYDDRARLVGEEIRQVSGFTTTKLAPEDVFDQEALLRVVEPFQGGPVTRRPAQAQ